MRTLSSVPAAAIFGIGIFFASGAASAQTPASGRTRGHTLDLQASVSEAYDEDVPAELRTAVDPSGLQPSGFSTMMTGNASYGWQARRVRFGATGSSSARYNGELGRMQSLGHTLGLGLSTSLGRSTSLFVNQTASLSPSYLYGLFPAAAIAAPGDAPVAAPDYALGGSESRSYGTAVTLSVPIGQRRTLSVTGERQMSELRRDGEDSQDTKAHSVRSRFAQSIGRNGSVSAGYTYRVGDFLFQGSATPGPNPEWQMTREHGVDFGVDLSRALSASRRATFAFRVGASSMNVPENVPGDINAGDQLRATAEAAIGYQFARTWQARASYQRGAEFVAAFPEPVYVDGVIGQIQGGLTRQLMLAASAGYSTGESALRRQDIMFDMYTGTLRVSYQFTPAFAPYVEYLYYFYDFGGASGTSTLPTGLERNGVRVGFAVQLSPLSR